MHAYIISMHGITLNMHKMVLLQMVPHRLPASNVLKRVSLLAITTAIILQKRE